MRRSNRNRRCDTAAMIVRCETVDDVAAARAVQVAAFARPGSTDEPPEAGLLNELRTCPAWLDRFSLVAEIDGEVVGHVVCTRATVGDVPVLALGPIGVLPRVQRDGVGSALMHAVIGAAEACDEVLIGLLGSTVYYSRFGFVPARSFGIDAPDPSWGDHFQVRALTSIDRLRRGRFAYPAPFDDLG